MQALDFLWTKEVERSPLVDLREHVIRLCYAADEIKRRLGDDAWASVSNNLHMAASLRDVAADADLRGSSFLCSTAADYEESLSELTRRHLGGSIAFNLCWTAYEGAVEIASAPLSLRGPKGARGRNLIRTLDGASRFPYLRRCVDASARFFDTSTRDLAEFRRLMSTDEFAPGGAELMRHFRNKVVHGAFERPEPGGWGPGSDYEADEDESVVCFRHHTRLVLLLSQVLMIGAVGPELVIPRWFGLRDGSEQHLGGELAPAYEVLARLHFHEQTLPLFPEMPN